MSKDILKIRVGDLVPNPYNPRQTYNEESIQELADSMVGVGQISPVLVRPHVDHDGMFEIIAGHRRVLAKKKIGGEDELVDCISRDLSDEEALEAAIVENAAREDVHPMEEAVAFDRLLRMGLSQAQITLKTGKRTSYINSRLRLLGLGKKSRALFLANRMSLDAAYLLARVEESSQDACLRQTNVTGEDMISDWDVERSLKMVLRRLSEAPWDLESDYAKKVACSSCPYRTQAQSALFDDGLSGDDSCTRPKCWDAKMKHYYKEQEKEFKANPVDGNPLILGDTYTNEGGVSQRIFNVRSISYYAPFVDLGAHCSSDTSGQMRAGLCKKPHESQVDDDGNLIHFDPDQVLSWHDAYTLVFGEKPRPGHEDVWLAKDGDGCARFLLGKGTAKKILRAFKKNPTQVNHQTGRTNEEEDQMKEARKKARARKNAAEKIAPAIMEVANGHTDLRSVLVILWNTYPFSRANEKKIQEMQEAVSAMTDFEVATEIQKLIFQTILSEKDWIENTANHIAARLIGFDIDTALEEALTPKIKDKESDSESKTRSKRKKKSVESPAEESTEEEATEEKATEEVSDEDG